MYVRTSFIAPERNGPRAKLSVTQSLQIILLYSMVNKGYAHCSKLPRIVSFFARKASYYSVFRKKKMDRWRFHSSFPDFSILSDFAMEKVDEIPISLRKHVLKCNARFARNVVK